MKGEVCSLLSNTVGKCLSWKLVAVLELVVLRASPVGKI